MDSTIIAEQLSNIFNKYIHENKIEELYQKSHEFGMLYTGNSICIECTINGYNVECILDTGAEGNLISNNIVKNLHIENYVDYSLKTNCLGATGSGTTDGFVPYIPMFCGNIECPTNFVVSGFNHILLGVPFLKYYNVKIDYENNIIEIKGHKVPFKYFKN